MLLSNMFFTLLRVTGHRETLLPQVTTCQASKVSTTTTPSPSLNPVLQPGLEKRGRDKTLHFQIRKSSAHSHLEKRHLGLKSKKPKKPKIFQKVRAKIQRARKITPGIDIPAQQTTGAPVQTPAATIPIATTAAPVQTRRFPA